VSAELTPIVFALCASLLFGVIVLTAKNGLDSADPQTGSLIILSMATIVFWITMPFWFRAESLWTTGFWIFCLNGLMHPMLSMYCALQATTRTHASVAATLTATAPLFASASAVILLGEQITTPIALGTLAIVAGVGLLSWVPQHLRKVMFVAILFATVTAIVRGVTQSTGKYGLNLTFDPPLAACASFTVSAVGSWLIFFITRGRAPRKIPTAGLKWFAITGAVNAIAIFFMYGAIAYGSVTVVAPIIAASPVFSIIIGRLFFQERLSLKSLVGIGLVIAGVLALSLA